MRISYVPKKVNFENVPIKVNSNIYRNGSSSDNVNYPNFS